MGRPGVLPLSKADYTQWTGAVERSQQLRSTLMAWWDDNLENYSPAPGDNCEEYGTALNTNRDFTLVERKKPDLFFQKPDVMAVPSPLFEEQAGLLDTHTKILNETLGPDGVDAKRMVHRVLFDVLCPAGTGWTKMGYESVMLPVPPATEQPGAVLKLSGAGQPAPTQAPIFERCFWSHFSPRQALIPTDAHSTVVDDWPWVGYEFEMPVRVAKRMGWVPETFKGTQPNKELYFDYGVTNTSTESVVSGVEIFYKSALYRDDRVHPLHQTQLILIDGIQTPAVHQDSPYQTLEPTGALSPDSLIGFPIHPLTIRSLTDAPFVASDCTISRPQVNELNKFRGQMIEYREAAILRWMYNVDTLPVESLAKIVRSPMGGFIGVPGEAFVGEGAIKELPHGSYPRENFTVNDYIDNDIQQTHGLGPLQTGAPTTEGKTATHDQIQQSNVNARLAFERGIVLDWYCAGVTKYSTLVQRFMPVQDAAKIVGQQAATDWDGWRKTVPASLAFTAMPDSALQSDLAWERKRVMDEYSFWINAPHINKAELTKETLKKTRWSPKVFEEQPPASGPEPPKISFAVKAEDMDPLSPAYGNVYQVLTQMGFQNLAPPTVDPMTAHTIQAQQEAAAKPDMEHKGKLPQAENLSKHHAQLTGGVQGSGAVVGTGAGGIQ